MQGSQFKLGAAASGEFDAQAGGEFPVDVSRRSLLRSILMGIGAAGLPSWWSADVLAAVGGPELDIPLGPLGAQDLGPLEKKTLTSGAIAGVDDQVYAPAGFDIRVVARTGLNPLTGDTSGLVWHNAPDGGAVFPVVADGGWIYVSNSEINPGGGVGALRFAADGSVTGHQRILTGTRQNCGGGPTPWGTWLSGEEVSGTGLVYECDPFGLVAGVSRPALGAFAHEAVAIDPINHVAYLTEDAGSGRFRRFVSDPTDLTVGSDGITRMGLVTGVRQRLQIDGLTVDTVVANTAAGSASVRQARKVSWVADTGTNGTRFAGGEGCWYLEIPEALRTIPSAGTVPTRGVIFFSTKTDNRIWAVDVENSLIELIVDSHNSQSFTNLQPGRTVDNWNQVDNIFVSAQGDVLVAEDGSYSRLAVVINNEPSKLLFQTLVSGTELTGPGITADGSRLYVSSQRGVSGPTGVGRSGTTFEITIPPRFRKIQVADAFSFLERANVAPSTVVTSEAVTVAGFLGPLTVTVSLLNNAQFSVNDGAFTNLPAPIEAGQSLRVRHTSAAAGNTATETVVSLAGRTSTTFRSVTTSLDRVPDAFSFGTQTGVAPGALIESVVITPTGFNTAVQILPATGLEYSVDGGAYTAAAGSLLPNQTLQVRHTASSSALAYTKTSLKLGGVVGFFTTRTR